MTSKRGPNRLLRTKLVIYALLFIIAAGGLLWLLGPREPVDLAIRFDPTRLGDDLDRYLQESEAQVEDLRESAAKEIVWAYPESKAKTPVSLVYLHGFSAAKGEIRPVPDDVAKRTGANLFYTRLSGHGRDGRAMATASVSDWLNDLAEAVTIGERIGEKVVVIATSTGGTLAALAATHPDLKGRIDGIVLLSPNFALQAATAGILTVPFARQIVPVVAGAERSFEPLNEAHARHWTTRYPSVSLLPMAALVKHVRSLPYETIRVPALFIFHPDDQVVDHLATAQVAKRWGATARIVEIKRSEDPYNHVIAGDALSPSNNTATADAIVGFINGL